jgi:hypothetical protein
MVRDYRVLHYIHDDRSLAHHDKLLAHWVGT